MEYLTKRWLRFDQLSLQAQRQLRNGEKLRARWAGQQTHQQRCIDVHCCNNNPDDNESNCRPSDDDDISTSSNE